MSSQREWKAAEPASPSNRMDPATLDDFKCAAPITALETTDAAFFAPVHRAMDRASAANAPSNIVKGQFPASFSKL